ncbi:MAG: DUF3592 domain-containing protein [Anaerolineales bacterium]|jgi:hypothetical protein
MGLIFGLVFTAIGLFALVRGVVHYRTGKASAAWPAVEGRVADATVEVSVSTDSDGMTSRQYTPHVVYTYSIGGQQYSSDQVNIGSKWHYPTRARAEAKLNYQTGQRVNVHYNPENPSQAVLEPGSTRGAWGTLLIGIVFSAAGVAIVIFNL